MNKIKIIFGLLFSLVVLFFVTTSLSHAQISGTCTGPAVVANTCGLNWGWHPSDPGTSGNISIWSNIGNATCMTAVNGSYIASNKYFSNQTTYHTVYDGVPKDITLTTNGMVSPLLSKITFDATSDGSTNRMYLCNVASNWNTVAFQTDNADIPLAQTNFAVDPTFTDSAFALVYKLMKGNSSDFSMSYMTPKSMQSSSNTIKGIRLLSLTPPFSFDGSGILAEKEDAIIDQVAKNNSFRLKFGESTSDPILATNCVSLYAGGNKNVIISRMKSDAGQSLNDYLWMASDFKDKYIQSSGSSYLNFFLDLQKHDYNNFSPAISSCGSSNDEYIFINGEPTLLSVKQEDIASQKITVTGRGFDSSKNTIRLKNTSTAETFDVPVLSTSNGSFTFKMPDGMKSGTYNVTAKGQYSWWSNGIQVTIHRSKIIAVVISNPGIIGKPGTDTIVNWLDTISPNSMSIPWKFGSIAKITAKLRDTIDADLKAGDKVLVIGHSGLTFPVYNMHHEYDKNNGDVQFLFTDPPYKTLLGKLANNCVLGHLGGMFSAVHKAMCPDENGYTVANSPNTVDWTQGKALGWGWSNFKYHNPFDYPDDTTLAPNGKTNGQNLADLKDKIVAKINTSCSGSCSYFTSPFQMPISPGPIITKMTFSDGTPATTIYPGMTVSIAGGGFGEWNNVVIQSKTNPDIYYEIDDATLDANKNIVFTLPDHPIQNSLNPIDTTADNYSIKVSALDSDWSNSLSVYISKPACIRFFGNGPRKVVIMRGSSLSLDDMDYGALASDFMSRLRSTQPFMANFSKFSFYIDNAKVNDNVVSSDLLKSSSCNSIDGINNDASVYLMYANNINGPTPTTILKNGNPPFIYMNISPVFNSYPNYSWSYTSRATYPEMREMGHAFGGLLDEYVSSNMGSIWNMTRAQGSSVANCTTWPPRDYRNPADNQVYGAKYVKGCTYMYTNDLGSPKADTRTYYRPSLNGLMTQNFDGDFSGQNNRFNVIDCGYIYAGINGARLYDLNPSLAAKYWASCKLMASQGTVIYDGDTSDVVAPKITSISKTILNPGDPTIYGDGFSVDNNNVNLTNIGDPTITYDINNIISPTGKSISFNIPKETIPGKYYLKVGAQGSNWSDPIIVTVVKPVVSTPTPTPSVTVSPTPSLSPSITPTVSYSPTPTPTPSYTYNPAFYYAPTPTPSATITATPSPSASPIYTSYPVFFGSSGSSPSPSATPSASPNTEPSPSSTGSPIIKSNLNFNFFASTGELWSMLMKAFFRN